MRGASLHHESSCEPNTANAVTSKCDSAINHMQLGKETTWTENSQNHVKPSYDDGLVSSQNGTKLPSDEILQDGWSCLKYTEVDVDGLPDTVTALNDSGCQLCVVRADTVRPLNLSILGQAKLKGLSDHLLTADIVKIRVRLTAGKGFVNTTCAVVEKLNYGFILGSDIVDKLNKNLRTKVLMQMK